MAEFIPSFWVHLFLGGAFLIFGLALPELGVALPSIVKTGSIVIAVFFIVVAGLIAYRTVGRQISSGRGGVGGHARVVGNQSGAYAGKGGQGDLGDGGQGGNAEVIGHGSLAVGGDAGDGAKRHSE